MKELTRVEVSDLIGGTSQRRCDRIYRRAMQSGGNKFDRLSDRWFRLCS